MYFLIVDCIDMEYGYKIQDKEGLNLVKKYHENHDIEEFEKNWKDYIKNIKDFQIKEDGINLLKHLKAMKNFEWECNFIVKNIGGYGVSNN